MGKGSSARAFRFPAGDPVTQTLRGTAGPNQKMREFGAGDEILLEYSWNVLPTVLSWLDAGAAAEVFAAAFGERRG